METSAKSSLNVEEVSWNAAPWRTQNLVVITDTITLCFSLILGLLYNGEGHITQPEFKGSKLSSEFKIDLFATF